MNRCIEEVATELSLETYQMSSTVDNEHNQITFVEAIKGGISAIGHGSFISDLNLVYKFLKNNSILNNRVLLIIPPHRADNTILHMMAQPDLIDILYIGHDENIQKCLYNNSEYDIFLFDDLEEFISISVRHKTGHYHISSRHFDNTMFEIHGFLVDNGKALISLTPYDDRVDSLFFPINSYCRTHQFTCILNNALRIFSDSNSSTGYKVEMNKDRYTVSDRLI